MAESVAHIANDGRLQSVEEHLCGTAQLCMTFAKEFDSGDYGEFIGLAHDIGKYSAAFQRRIHGGVMVDHATAGAKECMSRKALPAAMCVIGHHGGLPDFGSRFDRPGDPTFLGRIKKQIDSYDAWPGKLPSAPKMPEFKSSFELMFWLKMLFSCLVDADYLDTEQFMTDSPRRLENFDSIAALSDKLDTYIGKWEAPTSEINRSRMKILSSCIEAAELPKGLFSLTVPTGSGKTIASLAFALRHARHYAMKRVIVVIPYTSIIEQNAAVYREILGDENVLEHHSAVHAEVEENANAVQYKKALATENWDAPIVVTSAVQFFESLYANRPSKCRKLHNLTNSVIIFDEAQMLPSAHLLPCVAAIGGLLSYFGSSAVLCTATQPALTDLFHRLSPKLIQRELCPDIASGYQSFCRVTYREIGKQSDAAIAQRMSEQKQTLCIVNSRKAAFELYNRLPEKNRFHLSTLMCPAHRKVILKEIRRRLAAGESCRVVSTSLIEAGVDIDFPSVFRELAGLDSVAQAAGRCNREGKRPREASIVTVFEREDAPPPMFAMQIGAAKEVLYSGRGLSEPDTISDYFRVYRELLGDAIDKAGVISAFENGIEGCRMPFKTVAERFHMIDDNTKTIYIPWRDGAEYVMRLRQGECSRQIYRMAGLYSIGIYEGHYRNLLSAGALYVLDEDNAILEDLSLYREDCGLSQSADTGKALFV